MQCSSKRNPCVICGRTASDRCRIGETAVLCHWGSTLHPPVDPHMAIGETVEINGTVWALAKTNCGHAGSSWLFVVHSGRDVVPASREGRLLRVAQEMAAVDEFERDAQLADQAHKTICALPLYESLPPARLREALSICRDGETLLKSLVRRAHRLRRVSPDVAQVADRMTGALKEIGYQQRDLHRFWHRQLLDPGAGRGKQLAEQLQQEVL